MGNKVLICNIAHFKHSMQYFGNILEAPFFGMFHTPKTFPKKVPTSREKVETFSGKIFTPSREYFYITPHFIFIHYSHNFLFT